MTTSMDHSIRDLGSARLRLRSDLIFTPQREAAQPYYLVEDPLNSRFFRLGIEEYAFVSLLDGRTTIHEAFSLLSSALPAHSLLESAAAGLCRWLVEMDLAHTAESAQPARLARRADEVAKHRARAAWNPLAFRLPIARPDAMFEFAARFLGRLYSPLAAVGWLLLMVYGAYLIGADWRRFIASSQGVFAPGNWLWLIAGWVGLKVLHELSHGIVCRRYGGTVREAGVMFVMFAPLAYVDVTSSWRFPSRWQRLHVSAAGMYIELLLASVAAIVWSRTESGWLHHLCFNIILMASLETLLFNANPLMKFDGYYMLSDVLGIPNLSSGGRQTLLCWAKQYLLGVKCELPTWPRYTWLIRGYGIAAFVWSLLVSVSLIVVATTLLHGAGIVLSACAVILWLGVPLGGFVQYLYRGKPGEQPQRLRFLLTTGTAVLLCGGFLGFVPWPGAREAPAVVDYSPYTVVRAASSGFVNQVEVQNGEQVQAGQLLVLLENQELQRELADLELKIRQSEFRARQFEQTGRLASQQAEFTQLAAMRAQALEKRTQVAQLAVRAPRSGRVFRRDLTSLIGQYLPEGDEVLSVGDEDHKEIRISIAQTDLDTFLGQIGKTVHVKLPSLPIWRCTLGEVIPRATLQPPHVALFASSGGPLAVKNAPQRKNQDQPDQELMSARFTGVIELSPVASQKLRAGQIGSVSYRPCRESIGEHLYHAAANWLCVQLKQQTAQ